MNDDLLNEARTVAGLIGTRIQMVIPSILAEGETFSLRISITGVDALPLKPQDPLTLLFEGSTGIDGLPESVTVGPDTSVVTVENLTAVGPDTATVRATVESQPERGQNKYIVSNPAWIFKDPPYRLFWGDIHVHTSHSNCHTWRCLNPEWCYYYARNISLLDFVAPADHLRGIASDPVRWPQLQELARRYNVPGEFVSFLAFESSHAQGFGGDNNCHFLDDDAPHFWVDRKDMRGIAPKVHLKDMWAQMDANGKAYFTAPHHTGRAGKFRSWDEDYYDPKREPLFEIYSSWGSSEMRHSRFPVSGGNNDAPSYYVDAIKAGTRFGLIASSDDHATMPGNVHFHRTEPYRNPTINGFDHKGLAAVRAPELTRQALFDSLMRRDTYATTHARSLVDMTIGDATMGTEITADSSLNKSRQINVRFTIHDSSARKVVIMRNGEEFASGSPKKKEEPTQVDELIFTDDEPIAKIALRDTRFHPDPFVVYYARIESADHSHQWTSPIWIDL